MNTILSKIIRRFYLLNAYSDKKLRETNAIQEKSAEELTAIQLEKLKRILSVAVNTVPYYKHLKGEIDFQNFSLDELKKFPVVDKSIIRNNFNAFKSSKNSGIISRTSGSTGVPFFFEIPFEGAGIEERNAFRAWSMGKDYSYKYGDPIIVLRSYVPKEGESLMKIDEKHNYWYLSPFHINKENLEMYVDFIKRSGAQCMRGYPSSIYIFTLLLSESSIKIPQIKSIFTSSEMLLPQYRKTIEDYWGVAVLDYYGQNENVVVAQQCWAGNYHNSDDYGIIEIDEENRIIGTSLNNYVMPFIRYNTQDKAIPLTEDVGVCKCGRELSIPFSGIEGRSDDILIKDDGTYIPTANFSTAMKGYSDLKQFQIIQNTDRSIILNLVIGDVGEEYLNSIKNEVTRRLGNLPIEIKIVDEIVRDPKTGKLKITIQKNTL